MTAGAGGAIGPSERVARLRLFGRRAAYLWPEGARWKSRSFDEVHDRIHAVRRVLLESGLRPDEPVLIQGPDHPDWVEALFGVFLAGGVAVPLEPATGDALRGRLAALVGARILVAPDEVDVPTGCRRIGLGSWSAASGAPAPSLPARAPETRAEIVFTSGTTGEPKGVVLTHGNLASDFAPLEAGYRRYRRLVGLLGETRVLSTLPMSHMFGQAVNAFVAPFMGLTVALVPPRPREVLEAARRLRAWGLFTVPRLLELMAGEVRRSVRDDAARARLEERLRRLDGRAFWRQAIAARRLRRPFGRRFLFLVSGGARLTDPVRLFWERCGYLLVQGYGLTETAPIVAISNPFRRGGGSVGKALAGQEIRIGPEGEIQVRGANVASGYYGERGREEEWFPTGDVGEIDAEGRLVIRGRIKDVIVTAEGENVHPSDVEKAFADSPGLREVAVIGLPHEGGERVHAVLIVDRGAEPEALVAAANARLMPKQRVKDFTVWPDADFPRTGTGKVRRAALRDRIAGGRSAAAASPQAGSGVRRVVAQVARVPLERLQESTRLVEDLGLASLDLVEIAALVEQESGVAFPEDRLEAATVGDLEEAVRADGAIATEEGAPAAATPAAVDAQRPVAPAADAARPAPPVGDAGPALSSAARPGSLRMPRWAQRAPVRLFRRAVEEVMMRPLVLVYARPLVEGLERLRGFAPPYLFVANHHSYMDTGLMKACLPPGVRSRIAPGMTTRYQRVFFGEVPGTRGRCLVEGTQASLVELFFGAWPLPETAGFRTSLAYAGELMDRGSSVLIFPEGRHVREGTFERFRGGIGLFARELRAPVVPVLIRGTAAILPDDAWWPRFGRARMVVGAPLAIGPRDEAEAVTLRLEDAVRALAAPV